MVNPDPKLSSLLQFIKYDMTREKNNYQAVIIKTLIENGFDDKIRAGTVAPYAAKPLVASVEEVRKKLTQANLEKSNFNVNEATKSALFSLKPFVTGSALYGENDIPTRPERTAERRISLTLEFSASEIPEILKICNQEISLK